MSNNLRGFWKSENDAFAKYRKAKRKPKKARFSADRKPVERINRVRKLTAIGRKKHSKLDREFRSVVE